MMFWWLFFIWIFGYISLGLTCSRIPLGTTVPKSPVDENYAISIEGNPLFYVPGIKYNVSLVAYNGKTFISFMISLEHESSDIEEIDSKGSFEIIDFAETRFSPRCANVLENTNTNIKTRVDFIWKTPINARRRCIYLRATVVQHRDIWFMDDGFLTKKLCEETIDDIDSQFSILEKCCACDEAKYELTFEGKWSRHTHPKDFPANSWRTRFSDIIGASHTNEYRFWQYGEFASEGLAEIAEHGSTRKLETELKDKSDQIRTIIKARGIAYPNVTGRTFAVFRVDSKHHLISLVSMIDPSPDWIVGVSGLELCLPNCSWVENKIHNLYPWDAGTDSGPSYMSADQPQIPPDVVRRIKSNFPNDPRSPFYDPNGAPMKPLATLYINRRRLYEKICENTDSDEDARSECSKLQWGDWSECSTKCGAGRQYRIREFKNPGLAQRFKCEKNLREERMCNGQKCNALNNDDSKGKEFEVADVTQYDNPECALSEWTDWSNCSVTCGTGIEISTRHYLVKKARKKCQKISPVKLKREKMCEGFDCGGEIDDGNNEAENNGNSRFERFRSLSQKREDNIPSECGVSPWSDFTPCIGRCGETGFRQRERKIWNNADVYGVEQPIDNDHNICDTIKSVEIVGCSLPNCNTTVPNYCFEEPKISYCRYRDVESFWFYDYKSDQCGIYWADKCDKNQNKFHTKTECEQICLLPQRQTENNSNNNPVNCVVSEWNTHICNATCGEGVLIKSRKVLVTPKNGGKPCPKHLIRFEKCYKFCDDFNSEYNHMNFKHNKFNLLNICRYSEWSAWTPCTASCGDNAVRQKTRKLLNVTLNYKCKDRVRTEKCNVVPCT